MCCICGGGNWPEEEPEIEIEMVVRGSPVLFDNGDPKGVVFCSYVYNEVFEPLVSSYQIVSIVSYTFL